MRRLSRLGLAVVMLCGMSTPLADRPAGAARKITVTGRLDGHCARPETVRFYWTDRYCAYYMFVSPANARVRLFSYEKSPQTGNKWVQDRNVYDELVPKWNFTGSTAKLVGGMFPGPLPLDHKNYGSKDVYFTGERVFQRRFKVTDTLGRTVFDSGPMTFTYNYLGRVNGQWVIPEGGEGFPQGRYGSKSCREDYFEGRLKPGEYCEHGPSVPVLQNPVLSSDELAVVRRIRTALDGAEGAVSKGFLVSLGPPGTGNSAVESDVRLWAHVLASGGCAGVARVGCTWHLNRPVEQVLHSVTGVNLEKWCAALEELLVLSTKSCPETLLLVAGWAVTAEDLRRADVLAACERRIWGRDVEKATWAACDRLLTARSLDEVFGILVDPLDLHEETIAMDIRVVKARRTVGIFCHEVKTMRTPSSRLMKSDKANCKGILPAAG
jgi:hypothetical protein